VIGGSITGLVLAAALQTGLLLYRHNFRPVVPGRVYRSAQLSGAELDDLLCRHGIRTIVNLRGVCPELDWYVDECRAVQRSGASLVDIGFSAGRLPPVHELRYLVHALDHSEYPILLHCRQGVDRTGLVSTLVLLLYTDTDFDEALRQLGLHCGHVSIGRTGSMDRFYDLYRKWLRAHQERHTSALFRKWIEHDYCAGSCSAVVEPLGIPQRVPADQPWTARIRAHNTSAGAWRMRPGASAGVHVGYTVADEQFRCVALGRGGLFAAHVPAGGSIDVRVALPALPAGRYTLTLDMVDEQQGWFYQHGAEPLEWPFVVEKTR
jgi:hypothetical protein